MNTDLRNLLAEAGMSYEAFAAAVRRVAAEHGHDLRTNKSAVSHWVTASRRPDPSTVAYMTEVLQRKLGRRVGSHDLGYASSPETDLMPNDAVGALAQLARSDVDRRGFIKGSVYSLSALALPLAYQRDLIERVSVERPGRVGLDEVHVVREITAVFNAADERLGGGFGRSAVVEYLATDVARYCQATMPDAVRQAMFAEAAQLAYLAGWKAHDIGQEGLAQRYYLHSYQLAHESGDAGQAAYVLRILAHQAYDMGHHDNCADLAHAAVSRTMGKVDSHTSALFVLTRAKASAMRGERHDALRDLAYAEKLMHTARDGDERPSWAGIHGVNAAQFHNHTAKVLADLGEYAAAEEHFRTSIRTCLDPVAKPRVYALAQTWLAEVQCAQGYVERACRTWSDALDKIGGIQSSRTTEAVKTMHAQLAPYRRRGVRGVPALMERGRAILAASTTS